MSQAGPEDVERSIGPEQDGEQLQPITLRTILSAFSFCSTYSLKQMSRLSSQSYFYKNSQRLLQATGKEGSPVVSASCCEYESLS